MKSSAATLTTLIQLLRLARVDRESLAAVLADLFEDTGGPATDQELDRVRAHLARAEQR